MRGLGFSLKSLLIGVGLIAMGTVALVNASRLWVTITGLTTCLLLLTSLLASLLLRGRQRAFWIGFAVFGWGYIAMAYGPYQDVVLTSDLLSDLGNSLRRTVPIPTNPAPEWVRTTAFEEKLGTVAVVVDPRNVVKVGKLLIAWLFCIVGALVGSYFYGHEIKRQQIETDR